MQLSCCNATVAVVQAPRVPVLAEDLEMKKLINTYGKTFHTWQVDRGDTLPLGQSPALPACCLLLHRDITCACACLPVCGAANSTAANAKTNKRRNAV